MTTITHASHSSFGRLRDSATPLRTLFATATPSPSRFGRARREDSIIRRAASSRSDGSVSGVHVENGTSGGGGGSGDGDGDGDETLQNAALLSQLLAALDEGGPAAVASLTSRNAPCEGARALRFMQWLSDRDEEEEGEEEASGSSSAAAASSSSSPSSHSSPSSSPSRLSRLGQVLTVLREGLHAAAFEELQEALNLAIAAAEEEEEEGKGTEGRRRKRLLLAEQKGLLSPSRSPAAENGEDEGDKEQEEEEDAIAAMVAQRWRALSAARGGGQGSSPPSSLAAAALSLSLSPLAMAEGQRRASALSEGVAQQRARSAMELMGRVRVRRNGGLAGGGGGEGEEEANESEIETETERALSSALLSSSPSALPPPQDGNLSPLPAEAAVAAALAGDPAPRILALLLEEPDPEARAALLPDAFDAGSDAESGGGGEEERGGEEEQQVDFVFTTPLKLVQAIDLELGRLERASGSSSSSSGDGDGNDDSNGVVVPDGERFAPPPLFLPGRVPAAAPAGGEELVAVLEDLRRRAMEFV